MNNLICRTCGTTYGLDEPRWKCDCGSVLDIEYESGFDRSRIEARPPTMWRYRQAIPIRDDSNIVSLDEGFTPLAEIDFGTKTVLIKQEHLLLTGSFKDRGASVLVSKIKELGITQVVEDSSGNAGCAIAAYCARVGIEATILISENVDPVKIDRIRSHGAFLRKVPGNREDVARAALAAADTTYYASHSWSPFFLQGTKTFAFEVCEQLGWKAPDTIILPVGNGTLLLGAYIGFGELLRAGITSAMPRLIAIQAAGCAPLYRAFKDGLPDIPEIDRGPTIAQGIAIATPVRGRQILEAVRDSNGEFITVEEGEIRRSLEEMRLQGFDIEPTSAATTAGISKYAVDCRPDEVVVSVFTGRWGSPMPSA
jgi:threonine synthase